MTELTLHLHSFVDLITNSSSTVYVTVHGKTEEYIKEFVNAILNLSGSSYTFDDLLVYEYDVSNVFDYFLDHDKHLELYEEGILSLETQNEVERLVAYDSNRSWEQRREDTEKAIQIIQDAGFDFKKWADGLGEYYSDSFTLKVKGSINETNRRIAEDSLSRIHDLFRIDASTY